MVRLLRYDYIIFYTNILSHVLNMFISSHEEKKPNRLLVVIMITINLITINIFN